MLTDFVGVAVHDPRLGPMHLSLFLAILYFWAIEGNGRAVAVSSRKMMPVAKIGGANSYYRVIRDLHYYGYIRYVPSCDPAVPSKVYVL